MGPMPLGLSAMAKKSSMLPSLGSGKVPGPKFTPIAPIPGGGPAPAIPRVTKEWTPGPMPELPISNFGPITPKQDFPTFKNPAFQNKYEWLNTIGGGLKEY
jgi:hypothetical protein